MTAPTFAPRPEPVRRAPAPARPHLWVVGSPEHRSRRLRRRLTAALVVVIFAVLFAIVALRVVLAQGQAEVDRLTNSIESQQIARQDLRLAVAELEAPGRIVEAARQRLGMHAPITVTNLAPAPPATSATPTR